MGAKARWLDFHHVVFGKIIKGMEVIEKINEEVEAKENQLPTKPVVIADSGLKMKQDPFVLDEKLR
eukprot:NODE_4129_length_331_cov_29.390071_g4047_i0.p1 GENE.NODE_4129_length_331_cov_29.390071_g4047_i0~~NODE_4129_length_331_cov_29.390071_g4047_i0.p1  ORF type:complete len:73 (-),score=29.77 NODE_4129_length_331_cov_29.390071_g4047_i0:111-308(-)